MKKKIVIALIAGMLAVSLAACGSSGGTTETTNQTETSAQSESSDQTDDQSEETESANSEDDGVINFDGTGYNVTFTRYETGTDYEGNPCLLYYYTFTNTGDENLSPMSATYFQCFQNGTQCDTATISDENEAVNNYMKDVQPGGSFEVCETFALTDTSDVTIEVSDFMSLSDAKDTQVIKLQQ